MVGTWLRIPPPLPLLVIRKLFVYNPSSTFTPGFCFLRIFYLPFSFSSSFNFFFSFFILFGSPFLFLSCSCLKLTFLISHLLLFIHSQNLLLSSLFACSNKMFLRNFKGGRF
uniref:Uncharacterized protein n=1 Tax=Cacopsylla melanoneura TaxID=428564 RepID=A0A8D8ZRW7_9HEMI